MENRIFKTEIGGKTVEVQVGKYAFQANGHCIVRCGETVVMANTCMSKAPRPGQDFFPLSVDYDEKLYAVGKIPGGFKKREGRPADSAILVSRLIDRPLRPLFPKGFFNDVSVIVTPLSVDYNNPPEPQAGSYTLLTDVLSWITILASNSPTSWGVKNSPPDLPADEAYIVIKNS